MNIQIKVGVVIKDNDKILLIKESAEKDSEPKWNIVKGSHEENETIFETAERECKEEAQLNVKLLNSIGVYISKKDKKTRIQFNFLAEVKNKDISLKFKEEQILRNEFIHETKWFSREELSKLEMDDFISNRQYKVIQDFLENKIYSLDVCKNVEM